jgi:hypothetical protein
MGPGYLEQLVPRTQRQASVQVALVLVDLDSSARVAMSIKASGARWRPGVSITLASSDWAWSFYALCAIGRLCLIDHPQKLARRAFHVPGP